MARPVWRGSINLGLVTVPVELYSATQNHRVHFRQFERGTSDRIRYQRVNERTGKEVAYQDIVQGYELDDGDYVLIEQDELAKVAPGRSRTIDIDAFVRLDEIDPVYFQKSYWLAPAKQEFEHAYGLLFAAMEKTRRVGIASFVMRGREYVAGIRAARDILVLDTLLFADDVREPSAELEELPTSGKKRGREFDMAVQLVESMSEQWRPADYRDTYTERVRKMVEDKKAGRKVTPESEPAEPTKVVDLFDALSRSVKGSSGKGGSGKGSSRKGGGRKSAEKSGDRDPATLTKSELDAMARELDIKGRSKLKRDELERAVRKATMSGRAAS